MKTVLLIFLSAICITASAQKLPNVQQVSLKAPATIKIDGKATEWDDKFQAYNTAASLFYTLANDNNNLYLLIQTEDVAVIKKILNTSIIFSISNTQKKDEKSITVSFPASRQASGELIRAIAEYTNASKQAPQPEIDSVVKRMNTILGQKFKEVQVVGVPEIKDPVVSVYNEYGINLAARFKGIKTYTFEIAIPLKYVTSISANSEINYNIKTEGIMTKRTNIIFIEESDYMRAMNYDTDFSGKYTLAK